MATDISGVCYYVEETSLSYSAAQSNCESLGARLFEPRSLTTNNAVHSHAVTNHGHGNPKFWLGINDIAAEGKYVFSEPFSTHTRQTLSFPAGFILQLDQP